VIVISIIAEDLFHSFDPVVKNNLQFKGMNFFRRLGDRLKELINIIEYMTRKRCLEKPESRKARSWLAPNEDCMAEKKQSGEIFHQSCFGVFEE
jgi:hypothetical protein